VTFLMSAVLTMPGTSSHASMLWQCHGSAQRRCVQPRLHACTSKRARDIATQPVVGVLHPLNIPLCIVPSHAHRLLALHHVVGIACTGHPDGDAQPVQCCQQPVVAQCRHHLLDPLHLQANDPSRVSLGVAAGFSSAKITPSRPS
jgi:hypothetical protein